MRGRPGAWLLLAALRVAAGGAGEESGRWRRGVRCYQGEARRGEAGPAGCEEFERYWCRGQGRGAAVPPRRPAGRHLSRAAAAGGGSAASTGAAAPAGPLAACHLLFPVA